MCKKNKRIYFLLPAFVFFLALYGEEEVIAVVGESKPVVKIRGDSSSPLPEMLPINATDSQSEEEEDDEDPDNLSVENNDSDADLNSLISQNILLTGAEIEENPDADDEEYDEDEI
jgi:hypothetical protein